MHAPIETESLGPSATLKGRTRRPAGEAQRANDATDATIDAISRTSGLTISLSRRGRSPATGSEGYAMTKPATMTSRFVDAVVTAAMAFSLIVHAQFLILPPHVV